MISKVQMQMPTLTPTPKFGARFRITDKPNAALGALSVAGATWTLLPGGWSNVGIGLLNFWQGTDLLKRSVKRVAGWGGQKPMDWYNKK